MVPVVPVLFRNSLCYYQFQMHSDPKQAYLHMRIQILVITLEVLSFYVFTVTYFLCMCNTGI